MKIILKSAVVVILLLSIGCSKQTPKLNYGEVNLIKSGFMFTEGPSTDANGQVYFTDQPDNKIFKYNPQTDSISIFHQSAERANGLYFDKNGHLLACADELGKIISINQDTSFTVLAQNYEGKQFNGPNDLWISPNGGIYFTDPYYQRPYWQRTKADLPSEDVYYISPEGKLGKTEGDFVKPNGLIGTPDGQFLYVADIGASKTYRFKISSDGSLSEKTLFCNEGSDGMTIDKHGNVYLTNDFVSVFDASGTNIAKIKVPEIPSNVTFFGADKNELFITARTSVYKVTID
ncbi:MAG: gluconolactonase [Flavobacteriales bacterium CG03_land_8_20_14_0_80_35_15]|nr:MAG: gluconolactonase [Flavobacteriales bacterium CG03_land_8_20_14_0_80_35_15]